MPTAQDLHDRLKGLADEFRGTPGLSYHVTAIEGLTGHLRQTIKQQAREAAAASALIGVDPAAPGADRTVEATVAVPPPTKPAPVVQVAKPAR